MSWWGRWRKHRRMRSLARRWGMEAARWKREDITAEANIIGTLRSLDRKYQQDFQDGYMVAVFALAGQSRAEADAALDPYLRAIIKYIHETRKGTS